MSVIAISAFKRKKRKKTAWPTRDMEEDGHSDDSVRNERAQRSIRASSYHTACSVAAASFKAAQAGSLCGVVFLFIAALCVASSSDGERIELDGMVREMPASFPSTICMSICLLVYVCKNVFIYLINLLVCP